MRDLQAKTRTGRDPILQEQTITQFQERLRGPLIQPSDADYDAARTVYNAMIDRHPALIARCANVADVITAVHFARDNDLLVSMRSGGHNGPGFAVCESAFDALYPPGLQWYWKGDFVNQLSEEAIALHVQYGAHIPSLHPTMHLSPINGAPHRVGKHATWSEVIVGVDPDPANNDRIMTWTRNYWEALHPYSAGGAYVNFMMDEGMERVQATYRGNSERLVQVKRQYDPANLFRVNQNITPAA